MLLILFNSICIFLQSLSLLSFSFIRLALSYSNYVSLSLKCSFSYLRCSLSCSIILTCSTLIYPSLLIFSISLCMALNFISYYWDLSLRSSATYSISALRYVASIIPSFMFSSFDASSLRSENMDWLSYLNLAISSSFMWSKVSSYLREECWSSSLDLQSFSVLKRRS